MSFDVKSPIHADGLADVLERVLDKGIVIAGDVAVSLVGIELLTIRLRLLIASVDKARELGINWWEGDPALSGRAARLEEENAALRARLAADAEGFAARLSALESVLAAPARPAS